MEELLKIFKALSDKTRLRIIRLLEGHELSVQELVRILNISQPKVSFHLSVLREAGFLKDRRKGRMRYYGLNTSEMFRRCLILAILERAGGSLTEDDMAF